MPSKIREILLHAGLALLILLPRLPTLGSFATLDEPAWLTMGADFYYALGQREFQKTVYEYQPAVTTMWIVTAGMLLYYPEYRGQGQGYLDYEKETLDAFMAAQGKDSRALLQISRLIQVIITSGLLMLSFFLLRRLVGAGLAYASILLISFDPFFLGQSRLINHEAMFAGFILVAILALAVFLFQDRRWGFLLASAVAGGLAQLTKSSGIALLAPVGLLFLIHFFQNRREPGRALVGTLKALGLWLAVLALCYVILWPGMWVAPGKMLHEVYGNAFSYALQGSRLIALDEAAPPSPRLDARWSSFLQIGEVILLRTTLLTWGGVILGGLLFARRARSRMPGHTGLVAGLAAVTGLVFILLFAIAQGRNSPHYTMTSYVMFDLLAAAGWFTTFRLLSERMAQRGVLAWGMAAVLVLQAASAFAFFPYYYTYQNPLMMALQPRQYPNHAYGEGLETAARYLSTLPGAEDSVALAYYGRGCFSFFYSGETRRFKPYYAEPGHELELREALTGADYLVLYPAAQKSFPKYDRLFAALQGIEPVWSSTMNGYEYVVIYRVDTFSADVEKALFSNDTQ